MGRNYRDLVDDLKQSESVRLQVGFSLVEDTTGEVCEECEVDGTHGEAHEPWCSKSPLAEEEAE